MDILFGAVDAEKRRQDVEEAMAVEKKEVELERREHSEVQTEEQTPKS